MDTTDIFGDGDDGEDLGEEIARAEPDEIAQRTRMLENEIKVLRNENSRLLHEQQTQKEKIKENAEKIKLNKQLPYLVANVVELLDMDPEDEPEEDGANIDLDAHRKGKCCVLKTSTRQTIFLPVPGLVEPDSLKPADLVGVNKDSYLILEALPAEFDSRVKAMEVDEKPTEQFNDVGGLEDQIQELIEAIVLPMTHKERFANLGIKPPKGALMYGPPGTGKTLIARACAAQTNACFLKLAGPQLVQMFIGDGAKLVRDAFALAKEKQPAIIFIDELDAVGTKRFDSELSGDREAPRTIAPPPTPVFRFRPQRVSSSTGSAHHARVAQPAGRLHLQRRNQDHRRDQPRRHPRPGAAPLGPHRSEDRVPAAGRGRARPHPADPLAQDERQLGGQL